MMKIKKYGLLNLKILNIKNMQDKVAFNEY